LILKIYKKFFYRLDSILWQKSLLYPYSNQSQFMCYQGWDEILMITLISSKKLGGYKIMRHTVFLKELLSEN
jgi:hypothetical protein